ncbi:Protein of unknown function [Klenkia marina]|uniref:DUF3037 domain-containing protein n=1 Tax=Klenkia marina TaxID=1960309 RepID=A0A1G4XAK6_9ACTN|nr:DUF3037 domain-containing protein [Klenkia marina]SCX37944.1 Protein of unknown function [Klenkia marina]
MAKYIYALVRCVPEPITGEFINVGAIAGDPTTGDWGVRHVENFSRVQKIADVSAIDATMHFLATLSSRAEDQEMLAVDGFNDGEHLSEAALALWHGELNNVVQLSRPRPVIAADAEAALDLVFSRMLIDPARQKRGGLSKARVLKQVRDSYVSAGVDERMLQSRVEMFVGDKVDTRLDIVLGHRRAVQLTQAWSFQRASVDALNTDIKAWGYAMMRLRNNDEARIITGRDEFVVVSPDVPLEVVIAQPENDAQNRVFDVAMDIFMDLRAHVVPLDRVEEVGIRARELLGSSPY